MQTACLNTVFLQFTKNSCPGQFQNELQTSNHKYSFACFLGPFLQLNVGSVEKETEPADYNPNSTRSEKVWFMDSD